MNKHFFNNNSNHFTNENDTETCVYCGEKTTVRICTPIEERPNYLSGCGQLCPKCYGKFSAGLLLDEDMQNLRAILEKRKK